MTPPLPFETARAHLFGSLLCGADSSEEGLKHDNSTLLAEHTQKQSQYMANAGLQLGATYLDAETLENVDIDEVNAALHWAPHQPRELPVDSFLADERLLPVHEAARILTGERGKPKRILLDWLHWAGNAEGRAGSAWWIRSAALEHKVRRRARTLRQDAPKSRRRPNCWRQKP